MIHREKTPWESSQRHMLTKVLHSCDTQKARKSTELSTDRTLFGYKSALSEPAAGRTALKGVGSGEAPPVLSDWPSSCALNQGQLQGPIAGGDRAPLSLDCGKRRGSAVDWQLTFIVAMIGLRSFKIPFSRGFQTSDQRCHDAQSTSALLKLYFSFWAPRSGNQVLSHKVYSPRKGGIGRHIIKMKNNTFYQSILNWGIL